MLTSVRLFLFLASLLIALSLAGCGTSTPSGTSTGKSPATVTPNDPGKLPDDADLKRQLDDALNFTLEKRRLDVKDQAAWQIIHGALAYKRKFLVRAGDKDVPAVEYALSGGPMQRRKLVEGDGLDASTGRRGVRALLEGGTKAAQGHSDQWMGYLSDTGLALDEKVMAEGKQHTIPD